MLTTRTGDLVTLREESPPLAAELQPMEARGWKEGRHFRASTQQPLAVRFCRGVSDDALQAMLDAGGLLELQRKYAELDADNSRLLAALRRTEDNLTRLIAAKHADATLMTPWRDQVQAVLARSARP